MIPNNFTFNGKNSFSDFGLIMTSAPEFQVPQRVYETININGRNGVVLNDNQHYNNVDIIYHIALYDNKFSDVQTFMNELAYWLQGSPGYHELSDSYYPDYYRLAYVSASVSMKKTGVGDVLTGDITFNSKPFKYLTFGKNPITIDTPTTSTIIANPENHFSEPKITIYGSGNVNIYINNTTYSIKNVEDYITIDSELIMAYKDNELQNNKIAFNPNGFPRFESGKNAIISSSECTKIEIIPRWCTL